MNSEPVLKSICSDPPVPPLAGQAALAELFSAHRDRLRRMVRFRLDHRVAARVDPSDVLQDAFLDAARQWKGFCDAPTMSPFLWLRFIAAQRLMAVHRQHLGAQKRDAKMEVAIAGGFMPPADSEAISGCFAGQFTSPSMGAMRQEVQFVLHALLEQMEPLDREVLVLRHFEELSNQETAESLGIAPAAASKRYIRALERLKEELSRLPGALPEP